MFKVDDSSQTMVPGDEGTLVRYPTLSKGDTEESDGGGTMIIMSTLEGENKKATPNVKSDYDTTSEISSNLGTMVINDNEDGDDDTMVTRSKRFIVYIKDIYILKFLLNEPDLAINDITFQFQKGNRQIIVHRF